MDDVTEDEKQAAGTRQAAGENARWLEGRGNLHRPISSLTMRDLDAIAAAAIAGWVCYRSTLRPQPADLLDTNETVRVLGAG